MKRRIVLAAVALCSFGAVLLAPVMAEAHGILRKRGHGCGDACASSCSPCCAVANDCAPAPAPEMVARQIVCYHPETRTREVECTTYKLVAREEKFTYMVRECYTEPVKQTRTVCRPVMRDVECVIKVMEPTTTMQKRPCKTYDYVTEPVTCNYTEMVPVTTTQKVKRTTWSTVQEPRTCTWMEPEYTTTNEKRTYTTYKCEPRVVQETVPVSHMVRVPANDCSDCGAPACGGRGLCHRGCGAPCVMQCVTEMRTVCRTVYDRVPVTQECTVPVTTCKWVQKSKEIMVSKCVPTTVDVDVPCTTYKPMPKTITRNVTRCVPTVKMVDVPCTTWNCVDKKITRTVCDLVPSTEECTVNVAKWRCVEKTGTRMVNDCVPDTKMVKQCYTVMVAETKTVMVPACAAPCDSCSLSGGHGRLFHR